MNTNNKKKSFLILVQEKILLDNFLMSSWSFFIFILFLGFLMILSSHSLNSKILKINTLKKETDELRSQSAQINANLMKMRLDADLANQLSKDSLKSLQTNSLKIFVNKKHDN